MSSKAVRAGRAFVELFAEDNKLYRTLDKAAARLKSYGQTAISIGAKAAAAGGGALAPLGKAFSDAMGKGADIKQLANRFGETTESVSALAAAFQFAGSDMDEFGSSMDGLKGKIKAAADANSFFDEQMRSAGTGRALEKLPLEKQLETLTEALQRIPDDTQRAIKAQEWFGEAGRKMVPYLKKGGGGLAKMKEEGLAAGGGMSAENIERSATASKALNTVWVEMKNTVVALGTSLLPTTDQTKDLTDRIREAFSETRKWISENKNLITGIAQLAAGLAAGGVALIAVGSALKVVAPIVGAVISGVKLLASGMTLLMNPIGLVAIAVAGLTALFLTQSETGRKIASDLGEAFKGIGQTFSETFGGVVKAIKAGDMEGAFKILGAGIKTVWSQVMLALRKGWNDFMTWTIDSLRANPWILPLIGGVVGGLTAGPAGALAGAGAGLLGAAGLELLADDIKKGLTADVQGAQQRVNQNKAELRNLLAKQPAVDSGAQLDGEAVDAARLKAYRDKEKIKDQVNNLPVLADRQKGVFAGPIGQQLGIGDKIAQRQLDVQQNMDKGIQQVAKGVLDLGKNKLAFVGGK